MNWFANARLNWRTGRCEFKDDVANRVASVDSANSCAYTFICGADLTGTAGIVPNKFFVKCVLDVVQVGDKAKIAVFVASRTCNELFVCGLDFREFSTTSIGESADPVVTSVQQTELIIERLNDVN